MCSLPGSPRYITTPTPRCLEAPLLDFRRRHSVGGPMSSSEAAEVSTSPLLLPASVNHALGRALNTDSACFVPNAQATVTTTTVPVEEELQSGTNNCYRFGTMPCGKGLASETFLNLAGDDQAVIYPPFYHPGNPPFVGTNDGSYGTYEPLYPYCGPHIPPHCLPLDNWQSRPQALFQEANAGSPPASDVTSDVHDRNPSVTFSTPSPPDTTPPHTPYDGQPMGAGEPLPKLFSQLGSTPPHLRQPLQKFSPYSPYYDPRVGPQEIEAIRVGMSQWDPLGYPTKSSPYNFGTHPSSPSTVVGSHPPPYFSPVQEQPHHLPYWQPPRFIQPHMAPQIYGSQRTYFPPQGPYDLAPPMILNSANLLKRQLDAGEVVRRTGTTKFFDVAKGFGFILDDDVAALGGKDVFVHYTAILMKSGFRCLGPSEPVEYDIVRAQGGGYQALNVSGRNAPLQGLTEAQWPVAAAGAAATNAAKNAARDIDDDRASTTVRGDGEETEMEEMTGGLKEGRMIGGKSTAATASKEKGTRTTFAPVPIVNLAKVNKVKFEKRATSPSVSRHFPHKSHGEWAVNKVKTSSRSVSSAPEMSSSQTPDTNQ